MAMGFKKIELVQLTGGAAILVGALALTIVGEKAEAAMPTPQPYIITLMCVQDDTATVKLIQKSVGSRGTTMFNGWSGAAAPAKRMRHHDMVGCLSVTRIQNWHRIAANEFGFDIVFTAEDSGESYLWKNVVHEEPDGTWLIA